MLPIVILIILSFMFYLFYKVKYVRSQRLVEKKWLGAKSKVALGLFVLFFGINTFFINLTAVGITVGIIFILIGVLNAIDGFKAYKHYLPFAIEEAESYDKLNA